jgi:hypothetical protein
LKKKVRPRCQFAALYVAINDNLFACEFMDWQIKHRRSRRPDVLPRQRNVEELSDVLERVGWPLDTSF